MHPAAGQPLKKVGSKTEEIQSKEAETGRREFNSPTSLLSRVGYYDKDR